MKLSDVMSHAAASTLLPQLGLLLFLAVFASILWRLFTRTSRAQASALARMVLDEAPLAAPHPSTPEGSRNP
ncbi:MAG TPA: hypothetical protein DEB06_08630 [Phycisphaerales bacterium]|nr:hypothetical protein [Phycisphaerales bacterium]